MNIQDKPKLLEAAPKATALVSLKVVRSPVRFKMSGYGRTPLQCSAVYAAYIVKPRVNLTELWWGLSKSVEFNPHCHPSLNLTESPGNTQGTSVLSISWLARAQGKNAPSQLPQCRPACTLTGGWLYDMT